jgi:hypothetical protein
MNTFRSIYVYTLFFFVLFSSKEVLGQSDYYVSIVPDKTTNIHENEYAIVTLNEKPGEKWTYKFSEINIVYTVSDKLDSMTRVHTFVFGMKKQGNAQIIFNRPSKKIVYPLHITPKVLENEAVTASASKELPITHKTGNWLPTDNIEVKGLLPQTPTPPAKTNTTTTKNVERIAEVKEIEGVIKSSAFQNFHTKARAMSLAHTTIVNIGEEMVLDIENANLEKKWIYEISDPEVLELTNLQSFEGKEVALNMPDLQAFRFTAKKSGQCYVRFHAITTTSWMDKSKEIVYKVWVR